MSPAAAATLVGVQPSLVQRRGKSFGGPGRRGAHECGESDGEAQPPERDTGPDTFASTWAG